MIVLKNEEMMAKVKQIEVFALAMISSNPALEKIFPSVVIRDNEVYEHSLSVCRIAVILGVYYNMSLDELINLAVGSLLHDIGKIYLNKDILYKPDRLSEDERIFVETHTNMGYKMIKDADVSPIVLDIVKSHHEKLNGKGYPDGLHSSQISIYVQLVTIADIFSALTSKRAYKQVFSEEKSFEIMENDKGLNSVAVGILKEILTKFEVKPN